MNGLRLCGCGTRTVSALTDSIQDLLESLRADTTEWVNPDIKVRYIEFLDACAWAEHCFFAGESKSSRYLAVLRMAEVLDNPADALGRLGYRLEDGKFVQLEEKQT